MLQAARVIRGKPFINRQLTTAAQQQSVQSEYTEKAEYPAILNNSYHQRMGRKKLEWHDKIKRIGTIEEKLIEINMPRYYGYKSLMLNDRHFPYASLPFFQYVTNTEFVEQPYTPKNEAEAKTVENFLTLIKADIEEALEFELDGYRKAFEIKSSEITPKEVARVKTSGIVKQLNRMLVNTLAADNRHLYELDADVDPRHEAFWFVGGIDPTHVIHKMRKGIKRLEEHADNPIDRPFQYIGKPFLALRHQHPLATFEDIDFDSVTSVNEKIPKVTIDPRALTFHTDHKHGTSIPGFWPGNVREYGLISFQDRNYMSIRKNSVFGEEDKQEALHSQGIISSYAWLLAQACYQGFSTYNDMNYGLASQTVITDGKFWSFYKYQMNTTCIHTSLNRENYRYNKCWGTKEMKLYDLIDDKGKIQGLNDDVLKNLIQFYINQPKAREHEMKPFLGMKEKKVADIEDIKQRDWLEKRYKHLVSNRPRHRLTPEVYSWEKLYKIDNDTKPLARRLRFFELGINPFRRQLNDHQPKYIPRHLRARGYKDKKIWEPTYYPLDHRMNIPKEMSHTMFGAPRDPYACLMDRKRKSYK